MGCTFSPTSPSGPSSPGGPTRPFGPSGPSSPLGPGTPTSPCNSTQKKILRTKSMQERQTVDRVIPKIYIKAATTLISRSIHTLLYLFITLLMKWSYPLTLGTKISLNSGEAIFSLQEQRKDSAEDYQQTKLELDCNKNPLRERPFLWFWYCDWTEHLHHTHMQLWLKRGYKY